MYKRQASACACIFQVVSKHAEVYQDLQSDILAHFPDRIDFQLRTVLVKATIIAASPANERAILFDLTLTAMRASPELQHALQIVLGQLALHLQYPCTLAFLADHLSFLVRAWLQLPSASPSLSAFPRYLLRQQHLAGFFSAYNDLVVPLLIFYRSPEMIARMASELGVSERDLVEAQFPRVFATVYPLMFRPDTRQQGLSVCEGFLTQRYFPNNQLPPLITKHFDAIVLHCFDLIWPAAQLDERDVVPEYSADLMFAVIKELMRTQKITFPTLLSRPSTRVTTLVLHLRRAFFSQKRTAPRLLILHRFEFLIRLMKEGGGFTVAHSRQLLHVLLHCLHETEGETALCARVSDVLFLAIQAMEQHDAALLRPYIAILSETDVGPRIEAFLHTQFYDILAELNQQHHTLSQLIYQFLRTRITLRRDTDSLEKELIQLHAKIGQSFDELSSLSEPLITQLIWTLMQVAKDLRSSASRFCLTS